MPKRPTKADDPKRRVVECDRADHATAIEFLRQYAEMLADDDFEEPAEQVAALIARMKTARKNATGGGR